MDGRADTIEKQVLGPLFNPLEMANTSTAQFVNKVRLASYWHDIQKQLNIKKTDDDSVIIDIVVRAISSYERSQEFARFSSKYDSWLQGKAQLSFMESKGFRVFERADKGNCAACHTLKKKNKNDKPLFTDFTYDNIGVPANSSNPYYKIPKKYNPQGQKYIDYGLGKSPRMKSGKFLGMFKVPSLRNIELTAPYMHNGVFSTLKEVVEFYNSRDLESKWGKPEVPYNVNHNELGDLKLTELDIDALVAFMKTLTDGYENEK